MSHKYHILYETTNLINGKPYIGIHSTDKVDDGYIGCGISAQCQAKSKARQNSALPFANAVAKYGYENFQRKILALCATREELEFVESILVNEAWVRSDQNYNAAMGGGGGKAFWTKDRAIFEFKKTHGEKYNYSLTDYRGAKQKVEIVCSEHGSFWQSPNDHKRGNGCPKCFSEKISKINTFSRDEAIKGFRKTHGNKYDYSKVDYKKSNKDVIIICKKHGEFSQTPATHLRGSGCKKCSIKKSSLKKRISNSSAIKRLKAIHGEKYDYSKVRYVGQKGKIEIICLEHGSFLQSYRSHKEGHGCKYCGIKKKSTKMKAHHKKIRNGNN